MADGKQLDLLRQGVGVWNGWRRANPSVPIDLVGAILDGADLMRADLRGARLDHAGLKGAHLDEADLKGGYLICASLVGARLVRADLSEAVLNEADLVHADLSAARLIVAYLVRAHLSEADLHGADLSRADLRGSDLRGADLSRADLHGARLRGVDASKATLRGANLHGARLVNADLSEADLCGADLVEAQLVGLDLNDGDLYDTIFGWSVIADVDLSTVKGLESARHNGPSTIGIDTIYKSRGNISESFLRGAGVLNDMIAFVHSLQRKTIEFYSCFVSYCSKDDDLARRLNAGLQREGVRCWFAPEDLKIGDRFPEKIDEAIRVYDKLLLLLSENSISSAWVRKEVRTALDKEKRQNRTVLFPIRLDDAFMDTTEDWADEIRRTRHVGDFRQWRDHDCYQQAFERLLRDLKTE